MDDTYVELETDAIEAATKMMEPLSPRLIDNADEELDTNAIEAATLMVETSDMMATSNWNYWPQDSQSAPIHGVTGAMANTDETDAPLFFSGTCLDIFAAGPFDDILSISP
jgi:hypothetical protein